MANTQGGFAGTASSTTDNSFRRANTINISGGMLESTNDVNLYAGADAEGLRSVLNYNAIADAYNKTTLPLGIDPSVKNTMSQANQVNIDGMVRSVRHTNLKAGQRPDDRCRECSRVQYLHGHERQGDRHLYGTGRTHFQ